MMKWRELSNAAGCVLERCWSLRNDKPTTIHVKIGEMVYGKYEFTEETYQEILKYKNEQEIEGTFDADFTVDRIGDTIICTGMEWKRVK